MCDLGPNTVQYLGGTVLVPAVASRRDQVAAYFRMAADFVANHCSNGQVLVLHGSSSIEIDVTSMSEVANSSCLVADVKRVDGQASEGPYSYTTYELRCRISKHDELRTKLADLERTDPMDSLKARLAQAVQKAEGKRVSGNASSEHSPSERAKDDCGRMTLATLLQGGGCK